MGTVKSQDIERVLANLLKVLPQAKRREQLDMSNAYVNEYGYECGTTHCHGGWYAVAVCRRSKRLDYTNGGDRMAAHLGFANMEQLEYWAAENPEIWGNKNGSMMFSGRGAFKSPKRKRGAQSLKDIYNHWTEVMERVRAIEIKEQAANIQPPVNDLINQTLQAKRLIPVE